jgi:hypothetical protein
MPLIGGKRCGSPGEAAVMPDPRDRVIDRVKRDTPALDEGLITPGLSKIRAIVLDRWARPGEDETRQEGMINMAKNQPSYGSVLPHTTPLYATPADSSSKSS